MCVAYLNEESNIDVNFKISPRFLFGNKSKGLNALLTEDLLKF